jgi:NADH:ubiquinone reductase (H+-translocating)
MPASHVGLRTTSDPEFGTPVLSQAPVIPCTRRDDSKVEGVVVVSTRRCYNLTKDGRAGESNDMKRIVVLGAGFAGLWAAAGAARALDERQIGHDEVAVTVVNASPWHSIRVRNYEADLSDTLVSLADVLEPLAIALVVAEVSCIDAAQRRVTCDAGPETITLDYDRLVFALGSQGRRPAIPGLREYAFDVDTYPAATRLGAHLQHLGTEPTMTGRDTVLVVGAGLTGIEVAAEMPARMNVATGVRPRVILCDRADAIGSDMGHDAMRVVAEALAALGVETRAGVDIAAIDSSGATLRSGERIAAATVIWCAGLEASPLTRCFPIERDAAGRLPTDATLKVKGVEAVFAAGDVARLQIDDAHVSVMSCQHARPMGRFAGHNVVSDLLGEPMLPLQIDWYTTILDLGAWGAVYTEGWDRRVVAERDVAKRTKEIINRQRIYPPLTRDRAEILAAAAPVVQAPPSYAAAGR